MRTKPDPQTTAFGIDIGKKVFHVVALNAAGAVIQRAKHAPGETKLAFAVERIRRTRRWDASESPATRAYCPCALELKVQLSAF